MAYNDQAGLVDAFDGIKDLRAGIIRCVGSPGERFSPINHFFRFLTAAYTGIGKGFLLKRHTAAGNGKLLLNLVLTALFSAPHRFHETTFWLLTAVLLP